MKRLLMLAILAFASFNAFAQYQPTTTWPYVYEDFTSGQVVNGLNMEKDGMYNVHLLQGTLHFIDGDLIKEVSKGEVFSARIGSDIYVNAAGKMMKVLVKTEKGYVVQGQEVDLVKLNSTGGAYGSSSSTVGTMALTSVDGMGGSQTNMNHMQLKASRNDGASLPLVKKIYLFVDGNVIFASKKDVTAFAGADKMKGFLSKNKIKWNNAESVAAVVDFIAQ